MVTKELFLNIIDYMNENLSCYENFINCQELYLTYEDKNYLLLKQRSCKSTIFDGDNLTSEIYKLYVLENNMRKSTVFCAILYTEKEPYKHKMIPMIEMEVYEPAKFVPEKLVKKYVFI